MAAIIKKEDIETASMLRAKTGESLNQLMTDALFTTVGSNYKSAHTALKEPIARTGNIGFVPKKWTTVIANILAYITKQEVQTILLWILTLLKKA